MNRSKIFIHKSLEDGKFYLLGPGLIKVEVRNNLDDAWKSLENDIEERNKYFQSIGLESEAYPSMNTKTSRTWKDYLLIGTAIALPILVGFFLFSYALTNQVSKLANRIDEVLSPETHAMRSEKKFDVTVEKYRPYLHKILLTLKEEQIKVDSELKK